MDTERVREIAATVFPKIKGGNDNIANDPTRWDEPMLSWERGDVETMIANAITLAVNEALEEAAETAWRSAIADCYAKETGFEKRIAASIRALKVGKG